VVLPDFLFGGAGEGKGPEETLEIDFLAANRALDDEILGIWSVEDYQAARDERQEIIEHK
jgi:hypothetical protein